MGHFEEEIISNIAAGNLQKASQYSKNWISSLSLKSTKKSEKLLANEAYLLSRYYLHRFNRLNSFYYERLKEKAHLYLEILNGINELRIKEGFDKLGQTRIWKSIYYQIHTEVAKTFAVAFSNQEFYSLDPNEILLLSKSLMIIENWNLSENILRYILDVFSKNALAHYYLSYILYRKSNFSESKIHLKNCLLWNPHIIKDNWNFIPIDNYSIYWEHAIQSCSEEKAHYLYFALLLEINILYDSTSILIEKNFSTIYNSFLRNYKIYLTNTKDTNANHDNQEIKPKILHTLCLMIQYYIRHLERENIEKYCSIMQSIDKEYFQLYYKNYISTKIK